MRMFVCDVCGENITEDSVSDLCMELRVLPGILKSRDIRFELCPTCVDSFIAMLDGGLSTFTQQIKDKNQERALAFQNAPVE